MTCPACGRREVAEFDYGGEVRPPAAGDELKDLMRYLYFRENVAGVQQEWWYHRSGCRSWFLVQRDTRTNEVYAPMAQGTDR